MSDPLGANIAEDGGDKHRPRESGPKRAQRPSAPGSLGFAAAVAVPCLAASLGLGLGTIYVPELLESPPTTSPPPSGTTTPPSWTTTRYPTTTRTTSSGTPAGFFRYTGPEDLVTVLPNSFAVVEPRSTGTVTARNQLDDDVEVRFGGAAPEPYGLFETISRHARDAAGKPGYRELALERTEHGNRDAVDWEFEYATPDGETRRSRSHHWRVGGIEYVLLVAAPPNRWYEASQLLDTMIEHSGTP
ncbi:hypothetical protein [Saccharothrix deserti]|uniref:hypothetical protein n=1 Tax=Saccharothrix deserti TaxID=2593674 RepID=UPI00131DD4C5|nr:hypothetical protein [Saccharothrix deserti]